MSRITEAPLPGVYAVRFAPATVQIEFLLTQRIAVQIEFLLTQRAGSSEGLFNHLVAMAHLAGEMGRPDLAALNLRAASGVARDAGVADDKALQAMEESASAALAARFDIAGGIIKNAVIRAAFQAAEEGVPIAMRHLVRAAVRECKEAGQLVREEDPNG